MTVDPIKNLEVFIVVEVPHQGPAVVWSRTDLDEVISLICGKKWTIERGSSGKYFAHDHEDGFSLAECNSALEAAEMVIGNDGQHGAILTAEGALEYMEKGLWGVGHQIGKHLQSAIEDKTFYTGLVFQAALREFNELVTITGDPEYSDKMLLDEARSLVRLTSQLLHGLSSDADPSDLLIDVEDWASDLRKKTEG